MRAAEVSALQTTEEPVQEAYAPAYSTDMFAIDEGNQLRVAAQVTAKLMQRSQSLFRLADEVGIVFEIEKAGRIINMADRDACLPQLFAKEHILIAVVTETLIERKCQHQMPSNHEVAGVEMEKGPLPTFLGCM